MPATSAQAPPRETSKSRDLPPPAAWSPFRPLLVTLGAALLGVGCGAADAPPPHVLAPAGTHVVDDFWGAGWSVGGGSSVEVACSIPARGALRFALRAERSSTAPRAWSVELDGALCREGMFDPAATPVAVVECELPAEGARRATLRFRVEGPPELRTGILCPVVGPLEPSAASAPDLALLVADTFRADNLRAYGAEHDAAPNLDALATRGLVCVDATAPAPWTLPSHASMFTGMYPPEHGVLLETSALPADALTIAEVLRDAGYRTGAVTDGLYLDGAHGMAQGFEWFDARAGSIDDTLERARAFLELDDGRPTFLFVQSYRAHDPYVASDRTRAELAGELDIEHDWESLLELFALNPWGWSRGESVPPELAETVRDMHALYLGAVRDLDRGFGELVEVLADRDFLADGAVLFTSDHGEAFGEHQELLHGQTLFREELDVPLVLAGADIEPGRLAHPVSLVDVARTLADLAGVAAPEAWRGDSILGLQRDRPVYAYGSFFQRKPWTRSMRIGATKWILPVDSDEPLHVFDVVRDPLERNDLASDAGAETLGPPEAERARWRRYSRRRFPTVEADLDESALEALRAAGYAGDGVR